MCGRARKGHKLPFVQSCTLEPLSEDERKRVLEEIEKEESVVPDISERTHLLLEKKNSLKSRLSK